MRKAIEDSLFKIASLKAFNKSLRVKASANAV